MVVQSLWASWVATAGGPLRMAFMWCSTAVACSCWWVAGGRVILLVGSKVVPREMNSALSWEYWGVVKGNATDWAGLGVIGGVGGVVDVDAVADGDAFLSEDSGEGGDR